MIKLEETNCVDFMEMIKLKINRVKSMGSLGKLIAKFINNLEIMYFCRIKFLAVIKKII